MAVEKRDVRLKVDVSTLCVLEAEARATDREMQEICREVLGKWAAQRIHSATLLDRLLRSEGETGIAGESRRTDSPIVAFGKELG